MNSCLFTFTFRTPSPTNWFEQLVWVLGGLVHVIRFRKQHDWTVLRIAAALEARIERVRRRLVALIEAVRAGRPLPVWKPRVRGVDPKAAARRAAWREVWFGIVFRRGWLCPLLPVDGATLGGYLEQVLQDAAFRRLMAVDPRIANLLRPFVRMLGADERMLELKPEEVAAAAVSGLAPSGVVAASVGVVAEGGVVVTGTQFFEGV